MVTYLDVGQQVIVTATRDQLPATCRRYAGQCGELMGMKRSGCNLCCRVLFGMSIGEFLPEELEVIKVTTVKQFEHNGHTITIFRHESPGRADYYAYMVDVGHRGTGFTTAEAAEAQAKKVVDSL